MTHSTLVIKSFKYPVPQITYLIKKRLWAQVLIGLFLGLVLGIGIGPETGIVEKETAEVIIDWLAIPANLFLKIIQMIIVPLIFASIIRGLTSSGSIEQLQKLGLSAAIYFVITTAIALTIGVSIATTIAPGSFIDSELIRESFDIEDSGEPIERAELTIHDIPQSIVGLVPSNPLASFMSGESPLVVAAKSKKISKFFDTNCEIEAKEYNVSKNYSQEDIHTIAIHVLSRHLEFKLTFVDLQVEILNKGVASSVSTARIFGKVKGVEEYIEENHEIQCQLKKIEDEWVFVRLELIDVLKK